ncbi:MAG: hypothetical protein RBT65_15370 [Methanolobus sp.]|nr:hypothetical protein [Methanolobus sp.]
MKEEDKQKFDDFREMFYRYLNADDLSVQEFELRCNMVNFVKTACIQTIVFY